ncbi:hypothetical protein JC2156_06980 [Weissella koreensis KCTC 3621]|uniref:hypothetical protein n=1 Tax=Weissella koreensis TaxID=165096 RepID=UPI00026F1BA7|nr:hypothetical protein [Weissella koreensis]EJF33884.1 hypothetical protein JC2156_06980 [Weissella koreensis KCTC 3621]
MNKLNRLKKIEEKNNVVKETESFDLVGKSLEDQNKVIDETTRVAEFLNDTPDILEDIDREFMKRTGITNKTDLMVLFLATGLQVVRQEIFAAKINKYTKSSRLSDKEAAENSHGGVKDKINRDLRRKGYYHTTVAEIDSNPVPFDTQNNSKMFGENLGGGKGHRFSTLGHDPILGWIFGTANIATRTVTTTTLMSYHVQYGIIPGGKNNNDFFAHHADTLKVLQIGLLDSIKSPENFEILIHSLIQEGRHLNSDVRSKQGLGIPFVALQDPKIAG